MDIRDYPKDYTGNLRRRGEILKLCETDLEFRAGVLELCKRDILFWINMFCWTKDTRVKPSELAFVCYPYQETYIKSIEKAIDDQYDEGTEKSRDMGVSWMILYVFTHKWRFELGADFRVGSRKEEFVDKPKVMDTLFEKLRYSISKMPDWMLPKDYKWSEDSTYMKLYNPENQCTIIGESANEDFGSGGRSRAILLDEFSKWEGNKADAAWTACYAKDTEALTINGWKLIKNIGVGDMVFSMNPATRESMFMPVTVVYEYFFDQLIHFKGKSVDLAVTENHQMMYETRQDKNIVFKDAKTCHKARGGSIPLTSDYVGGNEPCTIYGYNARDWMEFLGWFLSEGCVKKGSGGICISQSLHCNSDNVARIKDLLDSMGCSYAYAKKKEFYIHARSFNSQARDELWSLGKCHNKYIPREYLNMSKRLLAPLWESLKLGDGSDRARPGRKSRVTEYTTVSRQLADDVQELIQKIGYKATVRSRMPKTTHVMGRKIKNGPRIRYDITIGYKQRCNYAKLKSGYKWYGDNVYCVTTKFHTLYVRRNGVAAWCGNTADVTGCRLPVSTPKGGSNKFAILMNSGKEKIGKQSLHWTLHPKKAAHAYYMDGSEKILIPVLADANKLWKEGIEVRSPWYDAEAERRTPADLAQEVDIDYLKSGSPFFDLVALRLQRVWEPGVRPHPASGIPYGFYITGKLLEVNHKVKFMERPDGWLRIFELPKKDHQYVVAGDSAEGLEKGDKTAAVIKDKWNLNVQATINGTYPPEDFAEKLKLLSQYYDEALTAPENNNHGYTTCKDFEDIGGNLYYTRPDEAARRSKARPKRGFTTTTKTRPAMLDQAAHNITKNATELRDPELIAQHGTFVNTDRGKPEAEGTFLDDLVLANAICDYVIKEYPYKPPANKNRAKEAGRVKRKQQRNAGLSFAKG